MKLFTWRMLALRCHPFFWTRCSFFSSLNQFSYLRMNEKVTQIYMRGYFYILILKEFLIENEQELDSEINFSKYISICVCLWLPLACNLVSYFNSQSGVNKDYIFPSIFYILVAERYIFWFKFSMRLSNVNLVPNASLASPLFLTDWTDINFGSDCNTFSTFICSHNFLLASECRKLRQSSDFLCFYALHLSHKMLPSLSVKQNAHPSQEEG